MDEDNTCWYNIHNFQHQIRTAKHTMLCLCISKTETTKAGMILFNKKKKYLTYLFVEDMKVYFGLLEKSLLLHHIQDTCYLSSLDQQ